MTRYGEPPIHIGQFEFDLPEMMHYLYLPVRMKGSDIRLPHNVKCCFEMIKQATYRNLTYDYVYLTARKGWASPDNPLNRPGWHCDGFGTDDINYIWWTGPGTRFAIQRFNDISNDHIVSMKQFEGQVRAKCIVTYREKHLFCLSPYVVHATPALTEGCMRQFIKISFSNQRYNLENNSHNYLFDYDWPLTSHELLRNDPAGAQSQ